MICVVVLMNIFVNMCSWSCECVIMILVKSVMKYVCNVKILWLLPLEKIRKKENNRKTKKWKENMMVWVRTVPMGRIPILNAPFSNNYIIGTKGSPFSTKVLASVAQPVLKRSLDPILKSFPNVVVVVALDNHVP
jgi:hypothetical protein